MSGKPYKVWDPVNSDESEAEGRAPKCIVYESTLADWAEEFAEEAYMDTSDDPQTTVVHIRTPDGKLKRYEVHPEPCVEWHAKNVSEDAS